MSQVARTVALNAVGGAWTVIRCTQVTRKLSIVEDGSANAGVFQGLAYQIAKNTGFGQTTWGPTIVVPAAMANQALEPVVFEGAPNDHDPNAPPIGNGGSYPYPVSPGGPVTQGTAVCRMTSASATATTVNITEWN